MAADGQVSLRPDDREGTGGAQTGAARLLGRPASVAGFAGGAADAFALLQRFEERLEQHADGSSARRSSWRATGDRTVAAAAPGGPLLLVADREHTLLLSGTGDLIEPDDGVIAIGSGGSAALAAARALVLHTDMPRGGDRRRGAEDRGLDRHLHQRADRLRDDRRLSAGRRWCSYMPGSGGPPPLDPGGPLGRQDDLTPSQWSRARRLHHRAGPPRSVRSPVALRNRWRRKQLPAEQAEEVLRRTS